jgi:mono/diheme cytochrome c family protein
MRVMKFIGAAAIVMLLSAPAIAQDSPAQSVPTIRQVPIAHTRSDSGKDMFLSYGAVCHGKDAQGNGPAAAAMKTPPADLTILANDNGEKYPASHVAAVIRGQAALASHGTQDMPDLGAAVLEH